MNIITTSRKPCRNTRVFVRQLAPLIYATYVTRGKSSINSLAEMAEYEGINKLVVVSESKGNPAEIILYNIDKGFALDKTYKITYYRLSEKKYNPNGFKLNLVKKQNIEFFDNFGVESIDSKYTVIDEDAITLKRKEEIGLRFKIALKVILNA